MKGCEKCGGEKVKNKSGFFYCPSCSSNKRKQMWGNPEYREKLVSAIQKGKSKWIEEGSNREDLSNRMKDTMSRRDRSADAKKRDLSPEYREKRRQWLKEKAHPKLIQSSSKAILTLT